MTAASAPIAGRRAVGLPAATVSLLLLGLVAVACAVFLMTVSLQLATAFVLVVSLVAVYVAAPTAGLACLWALWLTAPLLRRVLELSEGYSNASPLAAAPFAATAALAAVAFLTTRLTRRLSVALALGGSALVLGIPAGVSSPASLAFALLAYGSAVGALLLGFREGRRGGQSLVPVIVTVLPLVAVYGLAQYFLPLTPWDDVWLETVEFNSVGAPEEGRIRIFATINSPGTLAAVLSLGVLTLLASRRLTPVRLVALGLVGVALALTYVRSAWVALIPAMLVLAVTHRGAGLVRVVVVTVCLGVALPAVIGSTPTGSAVLERADTLGSVGADGSGQARTATLLARLPFALGNPVGLGLGSSGEPARLGTGASSGVPLDNGYLSTIEQLGPIGAALFLCAIALGVAALVSTFRHVPERRPRAALHLTLVSFLLAQAYFGDAFYGVTGIVLWYLLGWGFAGVGHGRRAVTADVA